MNTPSEWMDHLEIFGNQITENSEIKVTTNSGSEYLLQPVNAQNMAVITEQPGRKSIQGYNPLYGCFQRTDILVLEEDQATKETKFGPIINGGEQLVVVDSNRKNFIGSFGTPQCGFRTHKSLMLLGGGDFSITTSTLRTIKARNILPDTLTADTLTILNEYYDNSMHHGPEQRLAYPSEIVGIKQLEDPSSIRAKVSALVMEVLNDTFNGYLSYSAEDLEKMIETLGPFIRYHCYQSHGCQENHTVQFEVPDTIGGDKCVSFSMNVVVEVHNSLVIRWVLQKLD